MGGALVALLVRLLFFVAIVEGTSMKPTLHNGEEVMVLRTKKIHRFDVVLATDQAGLVYVKRVIGLPGDNIRYHNEKLYVNGRVVAEDFLYKRLDLNKHQRYTADFPADYTSKGVHVPRGTYFLVGDNRPISRDSRTFGVIPKKQIKGRVVCNIAPFDQFRFF